MINSAASLAIDRAKARGLSNAHFEQSDFLDGSFSGYDLISALECLYYLGPEELGRFFDNVAIQHAGKLLVLSGPIIGEVGRNKYFNHKRMLRIFNAFVSRSWDLTILQPTGILFRNGSFLTSSSFRFDISPLIGFQIL
jgi:cyclopropane fatty-acyl-phospholipid synthase-like methyltransferase